jgi:hypothetical protein
MAEVRANVRAYLTADRLEFVHEHDARAAFLAYPVGAVVAPEHIEAYRAFVAAALHPDTDALVDPALTAQHRLWRTPEGDLVHNGDPRAQRVAYEAGQALAPEDVAAATALGAPAVKMARPAANKMRMPAGHKAGAAGGEDSG